MKEHEEILNTKIYTKIDYLKAEASRSINQTLSPINSHNYHYSSNPPSSDITQWPLLKSLDFHSHASQFTKHLSPTTLKGNTLLQLQKIWDSIFSAFCQSPSTNKIWASYNKIKVEHYDITNFPIPLDNHYKYITAKKKF